MKITIVKKQREVSLSFNKTHIRKGKSKTPIVKMFDEDNKYLPVNIKLTQIQSRVPSTLLARWINTNLSEKLLTLTDMCNTIESIKDGVKSRWYFTNKENAVYGLHKIKVIEGKGCNKVTHRIIKIDDSLGMQSVINICKLLDIEVECQYDTTTQKMLNINLKGV